MRPQPYAAERAALAAELANIRAELAKLAADLDRRIAGARAAGYSTPDHVRPV